MPKGVLVPSSAPKQESKAAPPSLAVGRQMRRSKRSKSRSHVPSLPPDLAKGGRQILSQRIRFTATSTVSQVTIADYMLLAACGTIATTTTSVATIASTVRLRRITIWPDAGGEATIYWSPAPGTGDGQPDIAHDESIPTGITMDKPVTSMPPRNSLASFWRTPLSSSPVEIFKITATAGSIIDVELDFTICRGIIPTVLTVTGATVNSFYTFYLDGISSHKLQPLATPSI